MVHNFFACNFNFFTYKLGKRNIFGAGFISRFSQVLLHHINYTDKKTDGFKENMPLALIGVNSDSMVTDLQDTMFSNINVGGFEDTSNLISGGYDPKEFMRLYLGIDFDESEDAEKIKNTAEFRIMPYYPEEGSISIIDGVVVVKFSD